MEKEIKIPNPEDRTIYLTGAINNISAEMCIKRFEEIRSSDRKLATLYRDVFNSDYRPQPIELVINSFGGGVYDMMSIISVMTASGMTPVNTYCFGYAMSAAFIIFLHGARRHTTLLSTFMIHPLTNFAMGTPDEMQIEADESKRLQKIMNQMIYNNTKITPTVLKSKFNLGDWYITPKEVREYEITDLFLQQDIHVQKKKSLPTKK